MSPHGKKEVFQAILAETLHMGNGKMIPQLGTAPFPLTNAKDNLSAIQI